VLVALAAGAFGAGGVAPKTASKPVAAGSAAPAVEAGLLPWQLRAPLSREVVLPGPPGSLTLVGGLDASGNSDNGIFTLGTADGTLALVGTLPAPVHDAAGAVVDGADVVFGGGSPATVASVESFSVPSATALGSAVAQVSSLPAPRSDAVAVTVGTTTYVVGGYDGSNPEASVLSTTDGRSFQSVASLSVPVRYPAVAAVGQTLYVFGGQAVTGPYAGQPVDTIQAVDPARHRASVVGHLPEPLAGAAAFRLGGTVYLAGGDSSLVQSPATGVGTTQLGTATSNASSAPSAGHSVSTIWAFDPLSKKLLVAGRLQVPVSHAGAAVVGSTAWIVGGESNGARLSAVQMVQANPAFGTAGAPGAGSPYFGANLLVADRGNNRLLLLDAAMHVVWTYPSATSPPNPDGFFFPDDAFFVDHGKAIITNHEEDETIEEIAYPSGKLLWSYGHPKQAGTAPGYLHEPDDAYLLKDGQVSVADAQNCRVLIINPNGTVAHQIGTTGVCFHNPPVSVGSPNGDTPLADGNLLISEINGSWISEYTPTGSLVWTVHVPISYVSDPQQIGADLYLVADYASPGQFLEFDRAGQVLYRYDVTSGPGALDHPSLAELLPSGMIMANDDHNDRMVAIDPRTGALVWQYGVTGVPGTAPGMLDNPDGFDIILPNGTTPTHPATG
jgi:N-acetylneuraminic acid mutarotase